MKKYAFNQRNVRLNIISGVVIGIFGMALIVFITLGATDLPNTLLAIAAPMFVVYVAISGIVQYARCYHIEDDGIAIHKVFPGGGRDSLAWNEIADVRVRRYRNQVILTNREGNSSILIDTQLSNFGELFGKIQERFPDIPYNLKK